MDLATLLSWAYALLFSAACEWFSWLHAPSDQPQAGGRPERALLAFAVVALSCHVSSYVLSSVLVGFVGGIGLLVFAAVYWWQRGIRAGGRLGLCGWWSLGFVLALAFIFGPLICGQSETFKFPVIYDLPKHIQAMISAGDGGWPGRNPYFPTEPFAYNVLFYQPWAAIARLAGGRTANLTVFAWATVWMTWQTLGLLRRIASVNGLDARGQIIALLFATILGGWTNCIVGGWTKWIVPSGLPIGFNLAAAGKSTFWTDDLFISYIYVPQHIFATATIAAAAILLFSNDRLPWRGIAAGVLLTTSVLASFILAPLAVGAGGLFGLAIALQHRAEPRSWLQGGVFTLGTWAAITPWLATVKTWAGSDAVSLFVLPLSSGWPWVLLSAGIVGPLALVGSMIWLRRGEIFQRVCLSLVAEGLAFLALCHFPDSELKAAVFLRFWAVPLAAAGVTVMLDVTTGWRRQFLLIFGLVAFTQAAMVGVAGIGYFLKTAYLPREASETALISHLRSLPRSAWILMADPNQELAAVAAREMFYNIEFRPDRYLPARKRAAVARFFRQLGKPLPNPEVRRLLGQMDYLVIDRGRELRPWEEFSTMPVFESRTFALRRFNGRLQQPMEKGQEIDLLTRTWQEFGPINPVPGSTPGTIALHAPDPVDAGITVTVPLTCGIYEATVGLIGDVRSGFSGGAHFSLHGQRKLISIPAGNYSTETFYQAVFAVPEETKEVTFVFGFGGWSQGAGDVTLTYARLHRYTGEKSR